MGCVREGHTTCDSKAAGAVHAARPPRETAGRGRAWWLGRVRTLASLVCCLFFFVGLDCILIWWPASARAACVTGVRGEGVATWHQLNTWGCVSAENVARGRRRHVCVLVWRAVAVRLW